MDDTQFLISFKSNYTFHNCYLAKLGLINEVIATSHRCIGVSAFQHRVLHRLNNFPEFFRWCQQTCTIVYGDMPLRSMDESTLFCVNEPLQSN